MLDDFKPDDDGEIGFVNQRIKKAGRPRKDAHKNMIVKKGFKITQAELESMPGYKKPIGPQGKL